MGYKDIKAGKYMAKALQGAFGKSKEKNTPQVGVEFAFNTPEGTRETIWWVGFFTEKAKEKALETLALIGFNGDDRFGADSFDHNAEVEIVIELETYEGKSRPRVTWVNEPGGRKFSDLPVTEVKSMLVGAGIDLKKEMAAIRAKKGIKNDATTGTKATGPAPF